MKAPPGAAGAILLFSLGIGEFLFPLFPEEAADLVPKGRGKPPYLLPEHPPAREEGGFRSFKAFVIPAQCGKKCRDIRVEGIRFVVPDTRCHCLSRDFTARAIANYMDTDAEL